MKISLAQSDIVAAVQAHILSQGISLEGKNVEVDFSTTRAGKNGPMSIVAIVAIENAPQLPDLSEDVAVTQRPALAVVASSPAPAAAEAPIAAAAITDAAASTATGTDDAAVTTAAKTTSLFN